MQSLTRPPVGSLIRWFGTTYMVDAHPSKQDTIAVKMNNGIELILWWRCTPGNEIVLFNLNQ